MTSSAFVAPVAPSLKQMLCPNSSGSIAPTVFFSPSFGGFNYNATDDCLRNGGVKCQRQGRRGRVLDELVGSMFCSCKTAWPRARCSLLCARPQMFKCP